MANSNKYDSICVIDVEATCWSGDIPKGQTNEIIEIGITELDLTNLKVIRSESIIVRAVMSSVSEFCTQLTTLTQADVDKGIPLYDACQKLEKEYKTKEKTWASYGDYDRKMFVSNCKDLGVAYPFGETHFNIKAMLALVKGWKKEVGMARALERMGLELEGIHHRGIWDSQNITKILIEILNGCRKV